MPITNVIFFKDEDGRVPVKDWLREVVAKRDARIAAKCMVAIDYLRNKGRDCRRPYSDFLRDGIYELRIRYGTTNYRILYFFAGPTQAVVAAGLIKEGEVPDKEIDVAIERKKLFESDPERYGYDEQKG